MSHNFLLIDLKIHTIIKDVASPLLFSPSFPTPARKTNEKRTYKARSSSPTFSKNINMLQRAVSFVDIIQVVQYFPSVELILFNF